MNQMMLTTVSLLSVAGGTAATTGSATDLLPSASLAKRNMKVIFNSQVLTAGTFNCTLWECDTTNGTFTAVSVVESTGIPEITTNGVKECHAMFTKRYAKAALSTVAGTTATINLMINTTNLKPVA